MITPAAVVASPTTTLVIDIQPGSAPAEGAKIVITHLPEEGVYWNRIV